MSDVEKQVRLQKRAHTGKQQRLEALRKRTPAPGKRLAPYIEIERDELRKESKLAEAGKHGDNY